MFEPPSVFVTAAETDTECSDDAPLVPDALPMAVEARADVHSSMDEARPRMLVASVISTLV